MPSITIPSTRKPATRMPDHAATPSYPSSFTSMKKYGYSPTIGPRTSQ
jgi:hypothetical protein